MSSIRKFRSSASTNRNQGGGNKLSGLPPSVGGNPFARNIWARKATVPFDKRNVVFCINQLGGIGRKSSMFLSTADGVRCVQSEDDTVTDNTGDDDTGDDNNSIMSYDSNDDTGDVDCNNASTVLNTSGSINDNFGRGVSITNTSKLHANMDASYIALVGYPHADAGGTFIDPAKHAGFFVYHYTDDWTQTQSMFDLSGTTSGFSISKIVVVSGVPVVLVSRTQDIDISYAGRVVAYKYDGSFNNTKCSNICASNFLDISGDPVTDSSSALFGYSVAFASAEVHEYTVGYALIGEPYCTPQTSTLDYTNAGAAYMVKMKSCNAYDPLVCTNDPSINQITESGCGSGILRLKARFGFSVDMDTGDDISGADAYGIIGAPGVSGEDIPGHAYIVKVNDLSWCLQNGLNQAMLDAGYSAPEDGFGLSVAIRTIVDTQYAVVGAPYTPDSSGVAYVFTRSTGSGNSSWSILDPLTVTDLSDDSTLDGYRNQIQNYGSNVSISDTYIFVGNDGAPFVAVYDISGTDISYKKNIGSTDWMGPSISSISRAYISAEDDMAIVGYPEMIPNGSTVQTGVTEVYNMSDCDTSCCCIACWCPAGQGKVGDYCTDCSAGTYSKAGTCTDCPAGTYQPKAGKTECTDCPAETYNPSTRATECINCSTGTFQPMTGQTECITSFMLKHATSDIYIGKSSSTNLTSGTPLQIELVEQFRDAFTYNISKGTAGAGVLLDVILEDDLKYRQYHYIYGEEPMCSLGGGTEGNINTCVFIKQLDDIECSNGSSLCGGGKSSSAGGHALGCCYWTIAPYLANTEDTEQSYYIISNDISNDVAYNMPPSDYYLGLDTSTNIFTWSNPTDGVNDDLLWNLEQVS